MAYNERSKAIKSYLSRLLLIRTKLHLGHLLHLVGLFPSAFGSIILAWVGWLTWYDMTWWGKDVTLIFFGSRTGEAIGLGIGMKVIHYSLISLALLLSGLLTFLQIRSKAIKLHVSHRVSTQPEREEKGHPSECPHHFGYLASRFKNDPIPQECLICQKILECIHYQV